MKITELTRKHIKDICQQHHGLCEKTKCPLWIHLNVSWDELVKKEYDYIWCPRVLIEALENHLITNKEYQELRKTFLDIEIKL